MSAAGDERVAAPRGVARAAVATMAIAWVPVALWVAVIFALSGEQFSDANTATWLSSMSFLHALGFSPDALEVGHRIVRKSAHFVEYAVLSLLAVRALRWTRPEMKAPPLLVTALGVAALCAGADELWQGMGTLTRSGTVGDVVLDAVGACVGAVVGVMYVSRHRRRAAT